MGSIRRKTRKNPTTGEREEYGPFWIRYYRNGRRFEESTKTLEKGKAKQLLRLREGAIAKGEAISPAMITLTVDDVLQDVVTDYQINGKATTEDVARRIRLHLLPWFGGRRVSTLTADVIRTYIAERQEAGATNATINLELAALKRGLNLAVKGGKLLSRPFVPMLRENNVRKGFFEAEHLTGVCAALPVELAAVVTFASITGWRIPSEVLPLTWGQVDFAAGTVRLEPGTTKNRDGRVFKMTAALRELLEARQQATTRAMRETASIIPWVFFRVRKAGPAKVPTASPVRGFRKAWLVATRAAGCPGRLPHDLRRTAVRGFVRAGVPDVVAMRLSGHRTRSVFDRYNIVSEADLTEAAAKLDAATGTIQGRSAAQR